MPGPLDQDHGCGWPQAEMFVLESLKGSKANDKELFGKVADIREELGVLKVKMAMIGAGVGAAVSLAVALLKDAISK